jgi:hypothetical protein
MTIEEIRHYLIMIYSINKFLVISQEFGTGDYIIPDTDPSYNSGSTIPGLEHQIGTRWRSEAVRPEYPLSGLDK